MIAEAVNHVASPPPVWRDWSTAERASFLASIGRHRRAAWRVTLASRAANLIIALVAATLMSPIFYAAIALLVDAINLVVPMPNFVEKIGAFIGPVFDSPETLLLGQWMATIAIAALPGLVWMTGVSFALSRALRMTGVFSQGELAARAPDLAVLSEQRFSNTVSEMSVAAAIVEPRVLIVPQEMIGAAVFGSDERHATVIVTTGLLTLLDREQMQGIAAHLVATVADGDVAIGLRVATTQCVFGLLTRFSAAFTSPEATRRLLGNLSRAALRPNGAVARALLDELTDPLEDPTPRSRRVRAREHRNDWRMLFWIPFAGPVLITGFVCAIASMVILDPLVSIAWRQRKYMADAVAVRLTRDPDTLAKALDTLSRAPNSGLFGAWAAHLSVTRPILRADAGAMRTSLLPSFPPISSRLRALQRMGAHVSYARRRIPLAFVLIMLPVGALVLGLLAFALCLLVMLSVALSMLFLGLPFGIVHMLLRALGH